MGAHYIGSNPERQSVGDPGHCERCALVGHVLAHPDLGCGDVGCYSAHGEVEIEFVSLYRDADAMARQRVVSVESVLRGHYKLTSVQALSVILVGEKAIAEERGANPPKVLQMRGGKWVDITASVALGNELMEVLGHDIDKTRKVIEAIKADDGKHRVKLDADGWTIQHPLMERIDGSLFACDVHWTGGPVAEGVFVMEWDGYQDDWVLGERIE